MRLTDRAHLRVLVLAVGVHRGAVHVEDDGTALLYIDRHLVHEVTSPQAFEGLRLAGRKVWRTSSISPLAASRSIETKRPTR